MYKKVSKNERGKNKGQPTDAYSISSYQPNKETQDLTFKVMNDMEIGRNILTSPWRFFNDRSILQEMDFNQKRFNSYIPPTSEDPDESWRANTVRPLTRNKIISIAAHVTAKMLYPSIFAQNKNDEEDKLAAEVLRDVIEWAIDNSEYKMKFIGAVMGALTDPVAVMEVGFAKVMRKVREMQEDGTYTEKEIIDELLSGFVQNYRQCNEVYITNAFENNIQKQRAISIRTTIEYDEAKAIYGGHENFTHVRQGVRTTFDIETNTFYDSVMDDVEYPFVDRVVYRNRYDDSEVIFINGVLVSDPLACNPRKDKMYGLASFGYELLNNGNFFYYKSAVNKLAPDQDVIDTMYNMVMDGTFLQLMPPMALFGSEEVTSSIVVPGSIASFQDINTKIENIGPKSDTRAGMEAISLLEKSMSESSQDQFQSGIVTPGERTAEEISTIQNNAKTALGLFGKMIQNFVRQIGVLMVGDILQYVTVGELSDISTDGPTMKYKTIMLNEKIVNGKKVTKKLRFSDKMIAQENPTHDDIMSHSLSLLDEEEKYDGVAIYDINPKVFRDVKYMVSVGTDMMNDKSEQLEKALNLEAYDRLIQSPVIGRDMESMDAVTRDFLIETFAPGESDKYMPKPQQPQPMPQMDAGQAVAGGVENQFNQKGVNTNLTQQITGGTSIKKLMKA